jgi:hypothetical protein
MYSWLLSTRRAQRRFETGYTQVVLPGRGHEKRLRQKSRQYAYWRKTPHWRVFSVTQKRASA